MLEMKAIIADDEAQLRQYLKAKLENIWPELTICGEAGNGIEALTLVKKYQPDIAFLDIKMPGLSGIEAAEVIASSCWVVFITAYDEFAVTAFEKNAVDYILKPVTEERLGVTMTRIKDRMRTAKTSPIDVQSMVKKLLLQMNGSEKQEYLKWIKAQDGNDIQLIPVEEICYFKASDKYTLVITKDGEALIRKPIKELADELNPDHFWQINRGAIINVSCIARVSRSLTGRFILKLHDMEEILTVSRSYTHLFKQM